MENVDFGILCLIPPIITIILALVTKNTILSLFLGVWVGATIIAGWNPLSGLDALRSILGPPISMFSMIS